MSDCEVEFCLDEIQAWRSGDKATPGLSADGERYALRMRLAIRDLERRLIELGHEPTVKYVEKHGFCDGAFSKNQG